MLRCTSQVLTWNSPTTNSCNSDFEKFAPSKSMSEEFLFCNFWEASKFCRIEFLRILQFCIERVLHSTLWNLSTHKIFSFNEILNNLIRTHTHTHPHTHTHIHTPRTPTQMYPCIYSIIKSNIIFQTTETHCRKLVGSRKRGGGYLYTCTYMNMDIIHVKKKKKSCN